MQNTQATIKDPLNFLGADMSKVEERFKEKILDRHNEKEESLEMG